MIDLKDLLANPQPYRTDMIRRGRDSSVIDELIQTYDKYKTSLLAYELSRKEQNDFSKRIWTLSPEEKKTALEQMKQTATQTKQLQSQTDELKTTMDSLIKKIPSLLSDQTPTWRNDADNPVVKTFGSKPAYDFDPKPYRKLPIYQATVSSEAWAKAMWARGYYLLGDMARFQKVLLDYALDHIQAQWYTLMYVPLMLNEHVLTGTGHLPDFDGQQYEVQINDATSYYLIWSSEPSIMWYYMWEHLGTLDEPIFVTCLSSCFRKESWSYGKDQQGILRVHQFEKVEMVVLCRPEDALQVFAKQTEVNETIFSSLGLHYEKVEVCSWDLPSKHRRQQDYNARFPATQQYREICSNGIASDYQNRWLGISYTDNNGKKSVPRWLNDTGMTFRTWLAILEQNQQADWRVKIPDVLVDRFGKEYLG